MAGALVGASVLVGCSSSDPYGRNILVPLGSIYVQPAEEVTRLGYSISHVDTIIGYIEAYRTHGGPGSLADRITVDVFIEVATGRRVTSVAAQTLESTGMPDAFGRIAGRPTTPSLQLRRDAAELLIALGCEEVETEQRMTVDGIEFEAWCAEDRRTEGTQ